VPVAELLELPQGVQKGASFSRDILSREKEAPQ
jgi:hypothetical protein